MRQIPPLAAVRVFEAAARIGNFTRAADELGMTQAAVSYQIKLLEERLGAPLFIRSGRGIQLSELGRRIAPQVTGAFDALGEAFVAARAENEAVLTISAPQTFATNWLAGRLGTFQLACAPLAVRLHVSDQLIDLAGGDVDVAVRGSPGPWPGLTSHFVMRMPLAIFASPTFLARHGHPNTHKDILKMPRLSPSDAWWKVWLEGMSGAGGDSQVDVGVRFDSQVLDGNAALAGQGIAVLSPPMWQQAIDARHLVQLHPHVAYERNSFWLVYPERKRNLAKVRAFRNWLLAEVRRGIGDDLYAVLLPPDGCLCA